MSADFLFVTIAHTESGTRGWVRTHTYFKNSSLVDLLLLTLANVRNTAV